MMRRNRAKTVYITIKIISVYDEVPYDCRH